ncbi:MAG: hypothetical protein EB084_03360 [Proteobacteria bacterium]|nr:hypothetical protein [Pseudomonadota bacterium]
MKILLAAMVIGIIFLGFWMLDWQSKKQQIDQLTNTLREKQDEKAKMDTDIKQIDVLISENNKLKKDLKEVMEAGILPESPQEFVANYIMQISGLVERIQREDDDDSFVLLSLTPGTEVKQAVPVGGPKPGASGAPGAAPSAAPEKPAAPAAVPEALKQYPTRTFQMSMKGRYETLVDFLDRLGRLELQRLVTVNKLSLSPEGDTKGGRPVLNITMPLTAYLRTGGDQQ